MAEARFVLGQTVSTPGALKALEEAGQDALPFLVRHVTGDWGNVDRYDRHANEIGVEQGLRIFSSYTLVNGKTIWVITEADRSVTTVLLPQEY